MKQAFLDFRQEFDAVEAIGLYRISEQACLYSDEHVGTWPFALELCRQDLATGSEFFHLETNGNRFLGHYQEDHLLVFQLSESKEINIVILEMKTRNFLSSLINNTPPISTP